jgi:hypothetical protein
MIRSAHLSEARSLGADTIIECDECGRLIDAFNSSGWKKELDAGMYQGVVRCTKCVEKHSGASTTTNSGGA